MIYNHINFIQKISKEINMSKTNIVLQVTIQWVVKNINFFPKLLFINILYLFIYQNMWSYNSDFLL
jgi:hypothetical protein